MCLKYLCWDFYSPACPLTDSPTEPTHLLTYVPMVTMELARLGRGVSLRSGSVGTCYVLHVSNLERKTAEAGAHKFERYHSAGPGQ